MGGITDHVSSELVVVLKGKRVRAGEEIGRVNHVISAHGGFLHPMLHFELYSGIETGPLSNSSGIYKRRNDLLNPSPLLHFLKNYLPQSSSSHKSLDAFLNNPLKDFMESIPS
jgi:murein DD-endopeptidase MepM/ murein hydrolase activator NlpD